MNVLGVEIVLGSGDFSRLRGDAPLLKSTVIAGFPEFATKEVAGITVPVLSQAPPCRPSALEAEAQASHALRHRRKLPSGSALQGRVAANAAAATPSAPRASRALLHAAPRRRESVQDSCSSHAARKACIVAAGPARAARGGSVGGGAPEAAATEGQRPPGRAGLRLAPRLGR